MFSVETTELLPQSPFNAVLKTRKPGKHLYSEVAKLYTFPNF